MKLEHILNEAIDVSELAIQIVNTALVRADKKTREYFQWYATQGEQKNPKDPVQGAYDVLAMDEKTRDPAQFGIHWNLFNNVLSELNTTLEQYIKKTFGATVHLDRDNTKEFKHYAMKILLPQELSSEERSGEYESGGSLTTARAKVKMTMEEWQELAREMFSEFMTGNSTAQILRDSLEEQISVLVHELAHMINDIKGKVHHNAAYLKQGKAFFKHEDDPDSPAREAYGLGLLHMSRRTELEAIAAQIAWELVRGRVMTHGPHAQYLDSPDIIRSSIDDTIEELKSGYAYSKTLQDMQYHIEYAYQNLDAGERKQVARMWKHLLRRVIKNLEQYKAQYPDERTE